MVNDFQNFRPKVEACNEVCLGDVLGIFWIEIRVPMFIRRNHRSLQREKIRAATRSISAIVKTTQDSELGVRGRWQKLYPGWITIIGSLAHEESRCACRDSLHVNSLTAPIKNYWRYLNREELFEPRFGMLKTNLILNLARTGNFYDALAICIPLIEQEAAYLLKAKSWPDILTVLIRSLNTFSNSRDAL